MDNCKPIKMMDMSSQLTMADYMVVQKVLEGNTELFEILLRRYNELLYRTIRSYLDRPSDIDDVMQDTYIKAFQKLFQFKNESLFSTWLIRIGINEALQRKRKSKKYHMLDIGNEKGIDQIADISIMNPERKTMYAESVQIVEKAIDLLPEKYKIVYMLKEVQELGISEISDSLGLSNSNVKVRLHRARNMMKDTIMKFADAKNAFEFGNSKCDRLVDQVMAKIQKLRGH
ncbi:RNA polymerase sigma factor [Arenibacter sp. M-2]|uniref:RNA polymerase sigma factor n=1 Tax=unclassified Arenibacter TaxID=2615047 RepID=UPI000D9544E4|nr:MULTISPECIES: RNA polymerase sigma factor [unclassified Arenibacter]MDL5512022.1 RNA polymerase sigma factor [Arenibacter sp. M-2]PXX28418.1 RNA polymerase sigma-70 factor (ECF subfamily) [Arenibacter sp. ARW7G5Y1]